jgi:quercetin dioxygenase-like cupin family protein
MDSTADRPEQRSGMVVPPGGGRAFGYGPNRLNVKIGPEAGGAFGVVESALPPGGGPPPHRHQRFDEAFYVLRGEIEYRLGERHVLAAAGTCVFAPAGVAHSFRNLSPREACHLVITAPPEALEMVEAAGQPGVDGLAVVFARYDTELVG